MSRLTAVGLMSGTSYDGVDVALVDSDGEEVELGPTGYRPYSEQERDLIRRAIAAAVNLTVRTLRPKILVEAEELVTDMHAEAVEAFLAANGMPPSAVAVVGFHGQTVLHRPDRGLTIQLGNSAALAAGSASRWSTTSAPPMSLPAGRAPRSCRCSIAPWCARSSGRIPSACSTSAALPT
jgi:1,6-anhydro-N-acetylmuramate kinase